MVRLLWSLAILVGVASAQSSGSAPSLVAKGVTGGAMSANGVSPAVVSRDTESVHPLPDVPPLPSGKATLLGGTIQSVDHVRDRLVLRFFGGGRTVILFDERTHVFRGGKSAPVDDLKIGERAYVDTNLDGTHIFARNIRIAAQGPTGQSGGQIVAFNPETGDLIMRDTISSESVKMRLAGDAVILQGDRNAQPSDLRPGTLVTLAFDPGNGNAPIVRQISILASPGQEFAFTGRIEHVDLRRGFLVLVDPRDNKSYEVYFDPRSSRLTRDLRPGTGVTVQASFDGTHYQSRDIALKPATDR